MENFYSIIDNYFNLLLNKYDGNIEVLNDLLNLKSNIIKTNDLYNNKSYECYIINSIKKKNFQIDNEGRINSL